MSLVAIISSLDKIESTAINKRWILTLSMERKLRLDVSYSCNIKNQIKRTFYPGKEKESKH